MKLGYALNVAGYTKSEKIRNQLVKALKILTTEHVYVKSLKAREQWRGVGPKRAPFIQAFSYLVDSWSEKTN